jgi:Tol biopolymer transport system component
MPAASRDGRQVAYLSHPDLHGGLFVVDLAAMKSRQLTENPSDRSPMFGHDGKAIYVIRNDGGLRVVRVAIADGTTTSVSGPGVVEFAASPVDDRLIVVMEGERERAVMVQRPGEKPRPLERLRGGYYDGPSFSADGKKLLIVRAQTELLELVLDGQSPPRTLLSAPKTQVLRNPAYRPGGGVYVAVSASEGDLMLVNGRFP